MGSCAILLEAANLSSSLNSSTKERSNSLQYLSAVIDRVKNIGPIMNLLDMAHHTPIFVECNAFSTNLCGFSLDHTREFWLLTYPDR